MKQRLFALEKEITFFLAKAMPLLSFNQEFSNDTTYLISLPISVSNCYNIYLSLQNGFYQ